MGFIKDIFQRISILGVLVLCALPVGATQHNDSIIVLPDSSNFIKASLVVTSPGEPAYSALGHCALRMECPTHDLDYCFSFENRGLTKWFNYLQYFSGNMPAGFLAIPTERYFETYQKEGRGITQHTLNLSHHEKQELWRYLDNDMVAGAHRNFNFLKNNCASMCMVAVESVMWKEDFHVKAWPQPMSLVNGDGVAYLTRNTPWLQFFMMSLIGSEADVSWNQEYRISPELIGEVLTNADIINEEGKRRTALIGTPTTLLEKEKDFSPSPFTPNRVFGCLLALTILLTFCEWKWGWKRIPKAFDTFLLAAQTIIGCTLIYVTCVSCLFGLHWNWLLIPFNPLPILIWMLFRKKRNYHIVYGIYAIVLLLFIVLMPFVTTQVIVAHLLLAMTFAVRCVFKCYSHEK